MNRSLETQSKDQEESGSFELPEENNARAWEWLDSPVLDSADDVFGHELDQKFSIIQGTLENEDREEWKERVDELRVERDYRGLLEELEDIREADIFDQGETLDYLEASLPVLAAYERARSSTNLDEERTSVDLILGPFGLYEGEINIDTDLNLNEVEVVGNLGYGVLSTTYMKNIRDHAFESSAQEGYPEITLSVEERDSQIVIDIVDNGSGYEEDNLYEVFDSGGGLSNIKKFFRKVGGDINAYNARDLDYDDSGAALRARLPKAD